MAFTFGLADKEKCRHGSWFESEGDQHFLVARMDNEDFRSRLELLKKPYKRRFEKNEESNLLNDLMMKAMSEKILLDWKNIKDLEGKEIPYTWENGYAMLKDSQSFRDAISSFALDEEAYFKESLEK